MLVRFRVKQVWFPALSVCMVIGFLVSLFLESAYLIPQLGQMRVIPFASVLVVLCSSGFIVYRHLFMSDKSIENANRSLRIARVVSFDEEGAEKED